jgi:hypothetical protein
METLTFHIGRGGRFHNQGHLTCLGQVGPERFMEKLFERGGTFFDEVGHDTGCTLEDIESGLWRIDIDGAYNTTYTQDITNLSDKEKWAFLEEVKRTDYRVDFDFIGKVFDLLAEMCKDIYDTEGIIGYYELIN